MTGTQDFWRVACEVDYGRFDADVAGTSVENVGHFVSEFSIHI